jgi:cytochrome P450
MCIRQLLIFFLYIGRMVFTYVHDLLKSKEAYGEDAEDFRPFRFLEADSPATKVDRSFVVFGGGKHACPGYLFP